MNERFKPLAETELKIAEEVARKRETAAQKFPLTFGLTATYGLVLVFYGVEKIFDKVDFFKNNPFLVLAVGTGIIIATGTVYKKRND